MSNDRPQTVCVVFLFCLFMIFFCFFLLKCWNTEIWRKLFFCCFGLIKNEFSIRRWLLLKRRTKWLNALNAHQSTYTHILQKFTSFWRCDTMITFDKSSHFLSHFYFVVFFNIAFFVLSLCRAFMCGRDTLNVFLSSLFFISLIFCRWFVPCVLEVKAFSSSFYRFILLVLSYIIFFSIINRRLCVYFFMFAIYECIDKLLLVWILFVYSMDFRLNAKYFLWFRLFFFFTYHRFI